MKPVSLTRREFLHSTVAAGTAAALAPPLLVKVAIDQGIEKHDTKVLVLVVIAFLVSAGLALLALILTWFLIHDADAAASLGRVSESAEVEINGAYESA